MNDYVVPEPVTLSDLRVWFESEFAAEVLVGYALRNGHLWGDEAAWPGDRVSLLLVNRSTLHEEMRQ